MRDRDERDSIGWIPYWNLHPCRVEIEKLLTQPLQFHTGHPTDVNRMLNEGRLYCAPASAVSLLINPTFEIAVPYGVVTQNAVQSVYLGLSGETKDLCEWTATRLAVAKDIIQDVISESGDSLRKVASKVWQEIDALPLPPEASKRFPRLKLTSASASGAVLAKIFYRLLFGKTAYDTCVVASHYDERPSATLELVIGDEALARRNEFAKVFDLGLLWKSVTGLPFIFAVWQKLRKDVPLHILETISCAAEIAETKMHVEPANYFPAQMPMGQDGVPLDLASYWRCIQYRIGNKEMQGLLLFLCLARPLVRLEMDDTMIIRMLRWQQMTLPS